ncbi:hypothetical protein TUM19329_26200 [Legionella antarctica]|uniref:TIR domain-containing protein n=1 Tax=Legionella antarctica TaxID=2708020 RepID=A0A6F8T724_9GAMM|nr:hypothetical protein [Legionella antarctica]BCA96259.1 hypothetical protein TUM19329_26200 [Legionella antarctica]
MKTAYIFHNFYKPDVANITTIADDIATELEGKVQICSASTLPSQSILRSQTSNYKTLETQTVDYFVLLGSKKGNELLANCPPYAREFKLMLALINQGKTKVIPVILNGSAEECWPQELLNVFKDQGISPFRHEVDEYPDDEDLYKFISSIMNLSVSKNEQGTNLSHELQTHFTFPPVLSTGNITPERTESAKHIPSVEQSSPAINCQATSDKEQISTNKAPKSSSSLILVNRFMGSTKPPVTVANKHHVTCYISYDRSNHDTAKFVKELETELVRQSISFEEINKAKVIIFINSEPSATLKKDKRLEDDLDVIFNVMQQRSATIVPVVHKGSSDDLPFFLSDFMPIVFKNDLSKLIKKLMGVVKDSNEAQLEYSSSGFRY